MRRIIIFVFTALCLISCTKENNQTTIRKICNKWELTRWENYREDVLDGKQEGNFTDYMYSFSEDGTVKIFKIDGSVNEYIFTYDEETRVLNIPKLNHEYTVESVTSKEMKWRYDSWAIGASGPIAYHSYYFFTRK